MKCAEIVITLSSASLIFIPSLHSASALSHLAFSLVLLGFTVVYGLGFIAAMSYFHEMFLFNPDSFTAFRSSLMFTLGFGGLACFGLAYIVFAIVIAKATGQGSLLK